MLPTADRFPTTFSSSLSLLNALRSDLLLILIICLVAFHFNTARKSQDFPNCRDIQASTGQIDI